MVLSDRPMKRARKSNRVTADLYDIHTFPAAGDSFAAGGPFRESVKEFLSRHARVTFPPSLFPCLLTWQIMFRVGDLVMEEGGGGGGLDLSPAVVALDIVEEDVTLSCRSSRSVYCNQCRVVGWSGHPVCKKRYHFIIRANTSPVDGYQRSCSRCGNLLHVSESRCKWCDTVITTDDIEDWVYSQFEDNTHLLHGVVHSNGFGHLLLVNGKEGGSRVLTGSDIMNFWDRLCNALAVRKVSVMDVSRKYGVEYRLLHAITKGHSWYGNWGYEFGSGSYALTLDAYKKAVDNLSSVPLTPYLYQGRRPRTHLQAVIAFYRSLSGSELLTLKDLFTFLLGLIHGTNRAKPSKAASKTLESSTSNILCAWTRDDVERVQQAMIKLLNAAASSKVNWVTRYALKGAMCKTACPQLLDYCLKHLGGKLAANGMVVWARCNPNSSDIEFRLEPLSFTHYGDGLYSNQPSEEHIINDLKFLFDSLLHPDTMLEYRPHVTRESVIDSATKLLDCKQFMKEYRPDEKMLNDPFAIHLLCHVELPDQAKDDPRIPPELIILPSNATVADLKNEATKTFQEVYAMFKRFEADAMLDYGYVEDSITLKFLVGPSGSVRIKGRCLSKHALNHFRMERGIENWTVACTCGARDDDGERMLACDTCGVWQHTRCAGIDDCDEIPERFVCMRCMKSYRNESGKTAKLKEKEAPRRIPPSRTSTCWDEARETDSARVGTRLTVTFSVP